MTTRRTRIKLIAAVAALAGASLFGIAPAAADCVSAEVYYRTPGSSNQYVYGPRECVAQTPFPHAITQSVDRDTAGYGIGARVWAPAP